MTESESVDSRAAPDRRVFRLTSGQGFGAVINGNFVKVDIGFKGFHASVYAFLSDDNHQYGNFDNVNDAVAWAVATAAEHQGKPRQRFPIAFWEILNGYSITITLTDSGEYEGEIFALCVDSEPELMRIFSRFPTLDEAIQWSRDAAVEQSGYDDEHELGLQQIRDELEGQSG